MSKENVIQRLANFDFSSVQVDVIFEDDEDDSLFAEAEFKEKKTEIEHDQNNKNLTKAITTEYNPHEHRQFQDIEEIMEAQNSCTVEFKQSPRHIPLDGVKESENYTLKADTDKNKNLKRKLDGETKNNCTEEFKLSSRNIPLDGVKESESYIVRADMVKNKNLERKLDKDSNSYSESKICKVNTKTDNAFDGNTLYQQNQIVLNHQTKFKMHKEPPNIVNHNANTDNNSNTEMTCITNLLKSVSDHLICIIEEHNKYMQVRENKLISQLEKETSLQNFHRIKYHFFNLSFCTVDNIILPQENNIVFTGQFLNDTVRKASQMNRSFCLETQIAPLFFELLKWSKQKKSDVNKPIETGQSQQYPLLRQHLALSLEIDNISNTGNANTEQPKLHQNQIYYQNEKNRFSYTHQRLPSKPINFANESSTLLADSNRSVTQHLRLPPKTKTVQSDRSSVPNNLNKPLNTNSEYFHGTFFPSTTQSNNNIYNAYYTNPPEMHQRGNVLQNSSKRVVSNNNYFPPTNNTENSKSVVFSSGPPGRKINISINQSLLETCSNPTMTNTTAATNALRDVRINQSYPVKQMSLPSYEQATSQNRQNYIQSDQLYKQQIQQVPQHILTNNYLENNVQQAWPQGNQNPVPKAPCFWQQSTNHYYQPFEAQHAAQPQPLRIQFEQQNPDAARSISTDSGFMSPLNFNNSELNKEGVEDNQVPSPMITHITSLNPDVSFIVEGLCFVCHKSTRKMCVGCYKRYYCSYSCQRFDWNIHKATCRSSPS